MGHRGVVRMSAVYGLLVALGIVLVMLTAGVGVGKAMASREASDLDLFEGIDRARPSLHVVGDDDVRAAAKAAHPSALPIEDQA